MIVNTQTMDPMPVITGVTKYPDRILEKLESKRIKLVSVDGVSMAKETGNIKAVNVVLIGILASKMNIEYQTWIDVIKETVPSKFLDVNLKAFELGYNK